MAEADRTGVFELRRCEVTDATASALAEALSGGRAEADAPSTAQQRAQGGAGAGAVRKVELCDVLMSARGAHMLMAAICAVRPAEVALGGDLVTLPASTPGEDLHRGNDRRVVQSREGARLLAEMLQSRAQGVRRVSLTQCRLRRLDYELELPHLEALVLDRNPGLAYISEWSLAAGCPNLTSLSMVGTGVRNLWTAVAALRRLPRLTSVSFQSSSSACAWLRWDAREEVSAGAGAGAHEGGSGPVHDAHAQRIAQGLAVMVNDRGEGGNDARDEDMEGQEEHGEAEDNLSPRPSIPASGELHSPHAAARATLVDGGARPDSEAALSDMMSEEGTMSDDDLADVYTDADDDIADTDVASAYFLNPEDLEDDLEEEDGDDLDDAIDDMYAEPLEHMAREHAHNRLARELFAGEHAHEAGGARSAANAASVRMDVTSTGFVVGVAGHGDEDVAGAGGGAALAGVSAANGLSQAQGRATVAAAGVPTPQRGWEGLEHGVLERNLGGDGDDDRRGASPPPAWAGQASQATRRSASSPICCQRYYREFMLVNLPHLQALDGIPISVEERARARAVYARHFEESMDATTCPRGLVGALRARELGRSPAKRSRLLPPHGGAGQGAPARSGTAASSGSALSFSPHGFRGTATGMRRGLAAWPAVSPLKHECHQRPRQFEYNPHRSEWIVYGTLNGEVCVVNHETGNVVGQAQSVGAPHSILGLCWCNTDSSKLIAGTDSGAIQLFDVDKMRPPDCPSGTSRGRQPRGWADGARRPSIYTYDAFEQLTSVHINCTDDYFLASGYSNHVGMYDLRTGKTLQTFKDLHREHINVLKFANHSPTVFATSSFDRDIKMWDLRQPMHKPLYTASSDRGNVMVCFSPDDHFLLSSAVDNEVRQHLASDGRLHTKFNLDATGSMHNYTRSYYMNGSDYVISGSCEENTVHICCARTGRRLRDVTLEGRGMHSSLYVQSLRAHPTADFEFSVLMAYNSVTSKSEIAKVSLLESADVAAPGRPRVAPQTMRVAGLGG